MCIVLVQFNGPRVVRVIAGLVLFLFGSVVATKSTTCEDDDDNDNDYNDEHNKRRCKPDAECQPVVSLRLHVLRVAYAWTVIVPVADPHLQRTYIRSGVVAVGWTKNLRLKIQNVELKLKFWKTLSATLKFWAHISSFVENLQCLWEKNYNFLFRQFFLTHAQKAQS